MAITTMLFNATSVKQVLTLAILLSAAATAFEGSATVPFEVKRLNNAQPIISQATFEDAGIPAHDKKQAENINGPSLIRVPSWIKDEDKADPSAVYYCYFAHHKGKYIRMAWAATLEGSWTLFNAYNNTSTRHPGRGVLDILGPNMEEDPIQFTNGDHLQVDGGHHCASPFVVVDDTNQRILLFFHAQGYSQKLGHEWFNAQDQHTFVATSQTGLNFNGGKHVVQGGPGPAELGVDGTGEGFGIKPVILGNSYFSLFSYQERSYAFSNFGAIWAGPWSADKDESQPLQPWAHTWETVEWDMQTRQLVGGGNPVWTNLHTQFLANQNKSEDVQPPRYYAGSSDGPKTGAPRHFATRFQNDDKTLEVYYTSRGDKPERVFRTSMTLDANSNFSQWQTLTSGTPDIHDEVLRPKEVWEGIEQTPTFSGNGMGFHEQALRDPFIFTDEDGLSYILYTGNPEAAIGIASLNNLPTATLQLSKHTWTTNEDVMLSFQSMDTDGMIERYSWNWGDGQNLQRDSRASGGLGVSGIESHRYSQGGQFNVSLTVYDNAGGTFTTKVTLHVDKPTDRVLLSWILASLFLVMLAILFKWGRLIRAWRFCKDGYYSTPSSSYGKDVDGEVV